LESKKLTAEGRRKCSDDDEWVRDVLKRYWYSTRIISKGRIHNAHQLPDFIVQQSDAQIVSPAFYCTLRYRMGKSLLLIHHFLCKVTSGRVKKLEVEDFKGIEPKQFDDRALLQPDRTVLRMLLIDL
jgi:hypothetical protein